MYCYWIYHQNCSFCKQLQSFMASVWCQCPMLEPSLINKIKLTLYATTFRQMRVIQYQNWNTWCEIAVVDSNNGNLRSCLWAAGSLLILRDGSTCLPFPVSLLLSHPHTAYTIRLPRQVVWVSQQDSDSDRRKMTGRVVIVQMSYTI